MIVLLSRVERLKLLRAGQQAYRAGQPSTACPFRVTSQDEVEAAKAAVWVRGYVTTRNHAIGYQFNDQGQN